MSDPAFWHPGECVHGRTRGFSDVVNSGTVLFTIIGTAGLYFVRGRLYLYLVGRELLHGPDTTPADAVAPGHYSQPLPTPNS